METREPAVAGRFYEKDAALLQTDIRELFDKAKKPKKYSDVRAVICPHAGYAFSGKIAASSFSQINPSKKIKTVFLIASSHYYSFGKISVYDGDAYRTPLGTVAVDKKAVKILLQAQNVVDYSSIVHRSEHANEVQLPFLQYYLKHTFEIVPIVINSQKPEVIKRLSDILKPFFTEDNLFVISTDFSHYPTHEVATDVDAETAELICSKEPEALLANLKSYDTEPLPNLQTALCGWTSVLSLLYMVKGNDSFNFQLIDYANSGDTECGSRNKVVGYWAIALVRNESAPFELSISEKQSLLDVARHSAVCKVLGEPAEVLPIEAKGILAKKTGVFVSVYVSGKLRGCLGRFSPDASLMQCVGELAASSVSNDYRFEPIAEKELADLKIEISVLSPMRKISNIDEIVLGKHGVLIKKQGNAGTFLPQVAVQTNWTVEELLGHCARDKAHIGWDGWKTADIYIYEGCVFSGDL